MTPNFWRAPTDNDGVKSWSGQDWKPLGRWTKAGLNALHNHTVACDIDTIDGGATVIDITNVWTGANPAAPITHQHRYLLLPDGQLRLVLNGQPVRQDDIRAPEVAAVVSYVARIPEVPPRPPATRRHPHPRPLPREPLLVRTRPPRVLLRPQGRRPRRRLAVHRLRPVRPLRPPTGPRQPHRRPLVRPHRRPLRHRTPLPGREPAPRMLRLTLRRRGPHRRLPHQRARPPRRGLPPPRLRPARTRRRLLRPRHPPTVPPRARRLLLLLPHHPLHRRRGLTPCPPPTSASA